MARRPTNPLDAAEAVFKPASAKPAGRAAEAPRIPGTRESVTLRIESDVLEYFQADGPGWQDRMAAALRAAAGL
ncbi:BrnA antitoxin family protein [Mangrovicella endophytica]|uniref:BrnA antitoxin family protein n=1 Tax=Mangrovicella endophytica TaxID=2066697 RepID=UPI000C9DA98D|nr:BrnA antitoxin family protein [Mangrovicella endophytica]